MTVVSEVDLESVSTGVDLVPWLLVVGLTSVLTGLDIAFEMTEVVVALETIGVVETTLETIGVVETTLETIGVAPT